MNRPVFWIFLGALFIGLHSTPLTAQSGHASGVPVRMWIKAQTEHVTYNNFGYVVFGRYYGQVHDTPARVYYFDHVERWQVPVFGLVSVYVYRYALGTQTTIYGKLQVTGEFLASAPGAGDGFVSASTAGTAAGQLVTLPLGPDGLVRMEPGKSYTLSVTRSGLAGGSFYIAAPPQYRVVVNNVPRNSCPLEGAIIVSLQPRNDAPVGSAGFASTVAGSRIDWHVALGSLHNGDDAGALRLTDSGLASDWASLFTPGSLHYESSSDEVFVHRENNVIRQIIANQVVVDIRALTSTSYEVNCFNSAQMQGTSLPCSFSGSPFVTYRIEKDTGATTPSTALKFTKETRNGSNLARTEVMTIQRSGSTWSSSGWTLLGQTPLVTTAVQGGGTVALRSETITVSSGSSTALSLVRNYRVDAFGEALEAQTLGTSNPLLTTFSYYSDPLSPGNFGYLSSITAPGGSWEGYEYFDTNLTDSFRTGRIKRRFRPFGNLPAAAGTNPAQGEVTEYEYGPDPFEFKTRPTKILTTINGATTSLSEISYDSTATSGLVTATQVDHVSGSTLTSVRSFYSEGEPNTFVRGKPNYVERPDGVRETYTYEWGTWNGSTFTVGSAPGGGGSAPSMWSRITTIVSRGESMVDRKSTKEVTIRDPRALVVRRESSMWVNGPGWVQVSFTDFTYNDAGLLISRVASNGGTYTAVYHGLLLMNETDESGVKTSYEYDDAGRVLTKTRESSGGVDSLATRFSYDGMSNVLEEQVGWGQPEKIITWRQYDDAGRLTAENPPGNYGATIRTYNVSGRSHTVVRADGSTVITTNSLDGRIESTTGTGVINENHSYGVDGVGRWHQVHLGSVGSPRWKKTWKDELGRERKTERPGATSQPNPQPNVAEDYFYGTTNGEPNAGHLAKKTLTGYAPTLFEYDFGLGELKRSGLDINLSGSLQYNVDRFTGNDTYLEYNYTPAGGTAGHWLRTDTVAYMTAGDTTPTLTKISRKRLTGFAANIVAETESVDAEGNITSEKVEVNRSQATVKKISTRTGIANSTIEESKNGLRVKVTDHDGLIMTTAYDALLREQSITDSRSNVTTKTYVPGTQLVLTVTDAAGHVSAIGYDALGRVRWTRDQQNRFTYMEYNRRGQLVRQWGDGTYPVSYAYNAYGEKVAIRTFRNPSQNFESVAWPLSDDGGDAFNPNPANWTAGDKTTWVYDAASGVLLSKTDADGKSVNYTYNERGQTATREWARTIQVGQNQERVRTTYGYDAATGELVTQTYNDGTPAVTFTYGRAGQLETVTDYTTQGSFTGARDLVYDPAKPWRLSAETNNSSQTSSTFYGGRVITRLYHETGVIGRSRGFQVGSAVGSDSDLEQIYGYTNTGRFETVLSERQSTTSTSRTFRYTYRSDSPLLNSLAIDGGHPFTITRGYEAKRDLLTSLEARWGSNPDNLRTGYAYTYDERRQRSTKVQSGGVFSDYGESATSHQYAYNGRGELTHDIGHLGADPANANKQLPGRRHEYTYDQIGNRKSSNRTGVGTLADDYTTNSLNQYVTKENNTIPVSGSAAADSDPTASTPAEGATRVAVKGQAQRAGRIGQFWADEVLVANNDDNVNPHPWRGELTFYAYKRGASGSGVYISQNRWAEIPGALQRFEYDADGNIKKDGVWEYTWDAENRLIEMKTDTFALAGAFPLANRRIEFRYDYLHRRVQKRVFMNGSSSQSFGWRYLYDGWNLVAEYSETTAGALDILKRSYTWGLDIVHDLAQSGGVGALLQIADHAAIKTYLPSYDGNGNVVALFDADASSSSSVCVAAYEYSPFGELLRCEGSYARDRFEGTTFVPGNPFRFSTKFCDDETGLVYYGRRYYSPSQGRFLGRDPIEERGGLNLYGFCRNNAINLWDVLGMTPPPATITTGVTTPSGQHTTQTMYWRDGPYGMGYYSTAAPSQNYTPGYSDFGDDGGDFYGDETSAAIAAGTAGGTSLPTQPLLLTSGVFEGAFVGPVVAGVSATASVPGVLGGGFGQAAAGASTAGAGAAITTGGVTIVTAGTAIATGGTIATVGAAGAVILLTPAVNPVTFGTTAMPRPTLPNGSIGWTATTFPTSSPIAASWNASDPNAEVPVIGSDENTGLPVKIGTIRQGDIPLGAVIGPLGVDANSINVQGGALGELTRDTRPPSQPNPPQPPR